MLVQLADDGLGLPLRVPVLVARGKRSGPTFGMTSALHGNEINGIPVIHRLFDKLDVQKLRGTIVALVVANVPGYMRHQRGFSEGSHSGIDLNHLMPGRKDGSAAEVYAYRLVRTFLPSFDYLVDLHTASLGRVNSLYIRADMKHEKTSRMAYLMRPQIIVHNPANDHTLRGTAMGREIPSITVEIGNPSRFQPEFIRRTLGGLRALLAEASMLPKRAFAPGLEPLICERSSWMYTDRGGLLEVFPQVTDLVEEGELIARLVDVFGDVVREYRAPEKGVIIGKSVDPVAQTGARIVHLGVPAAADRGFVKRVEIDFVAPTKRKDENENDKDEESA
ncbi:MAG: succinylglutamate desuccinylase/aspartoacylase family protein [Myxococcales bacterium]|nr:succinylglutamate desuccinylase/aspartoacylase family protein [Myxococcales bacterium]